MDELTAECWVDPSLGRVDDVVTGEARCGRGRAAQVLRLEVEFLSGGVVRASPLGQRELQGDVRELLGEPGGHCWDPRGAGGGEVADAQGCRLTGAQVVHRRVEPRHRLEGLAAQLHQTQAVAGGHDAATGPL